MPSRCVLPTQEHFTRVLAAYDKSRDAKVALLASGVKPEHGSCHIFAQLAAALAKARGLSYSVRVYDVDSRGGSDIVAVLDGQEMNVLGSSGFFAERPDIAGMFLRDALQEQGAMHGLDDRTPTLHQFLKKDTEAWLVRYGEHAEEDDGNRVDPFDELSKHDPYGLNMLLFRRPQFVGNESSHGKSIAQRARSGEPMLIRVDDYLPNGDLGRSYNIYLLLDNVAYPIGNPDVVLKPWWEMLDSNPEVVQAVLRSDWPTVRIAFDRVLERVGLGRSAQFRGLDAAHVVAGGKFLSYHNVGYVDERTGRFMPMEGLANACFPLGIAQAMRKVTETHMMLNAGLKLCAENIAKEKASPSKSSFLDDETKLEMWQRREREVIQSMQALNRLLQELKNEALLVENRNLPVCFYPPNGLDTFEHEGAHAWLQSVVPITLTSNDFQRASVITDALESWLPTRGTACARYWSVHGSELRGTVHVEETFTALMGMVYAARETALGRDNPEMRRDIAEAFASYLRNHVEVIDLHQLHDDLWNAAQEIIAKHPNTEAVYLSFREHLTNAARAHGWAA